jgi:DNA-binding CsgD family transcriptional regulator
MDEASAAALVEMIDHAYASTLDPARWSAFLKAVSRHFRDASTLLWHTDRNFDRFNMFAYDRYEEKALTALQAHYHTINPWLPKKMLVPGGVLHRTEALYPERDLIKTEFYNDWLVPNDLFKGFGISLFNDRRFGFLSIIRSKKAGPPSNGELRLLELLMPHLQRAIQLHERFQFATPEHAGVALTTLDQLSRGVIFVDRDRRSRWQNRAASRILSIADGLYLDRTGASRTSRAADQAPLDRLIEGAMSGRWRAGGEEPSPASGGAMLVSRPSGRRPYCLVVAPTAITPFGLAAGDVSAVLLISDPDADTAARQDLLRGLYQLTQKEAQLAVAVAEGVTLELAARRVGITYATARSYLKSVFLKLGVSRQAELASLVQKLAPPCQATDPLS